MKALDFIQSPTRSHGRVIQLPIDHEASESAVLVADRRAAMETMTVVYYQSRARRVPDVSARRTKASSEPGLDMFRCRIERFHASRIESQPPFLVVRMRVEGAAAGSNDEDSIPNAESTSRARSVSEK